MDLLTSTVEGLSGKLTAPIARIAVLIAAHPSARNDLMAKHSAMNTSGPLTEDTCSSNLHENMRKSLPGDSCAKKPHLQVALLIYLPVKQKQPD